MMATTVVLTLGHGGSVTFDGAFWEANYPTSFELVRIFDCCLQGIKPCECKGKGHRWVDNQFFR